MLQTQTKGEEKENEFYMYEFHTVFICLQAQKANELQKIQEGSTQGDTPLHLENKTEEN